MIYEIEKKQIEKNQNMFSQYTSESLLCKRTNTTFEDFKDDSSMHCGCAFEENTHLYLEEEEEEEEEAFDDYEWRKSLAIRSPRRQFWHGDKRKKSKVLK